MELSTQFIYWHQQRLGRTQVAIAEEFGVSRQAISKAVRTYEYKVLVRLLALAHSIGALVEYHDQHRGLLIGQVVQLQNQLVVIVVDTHDALRVHYHSAITTDPQPFRILLEEALKLSVTQDMTADDLINLLTVKQ